MDYFRNILKNLIKFICHYKNLCYYLFVEHNDRVFV